MSGAQLGRRKRGTGGVFKDGGWCEPYGGYGPQKWAAFAPQVKRVRIKIGRFDTKREAEIALNAWLKEQSLKLQPS